MKKLFCLTALVLSLALIFVSCKKNSKSQTNNLSTETKIDSVGNSGSETFVNANSGNNVVDPDIDFKAYENFSTTATDNQIIYVMLMNQLQYSLQSIQYYKNKLVLEQEYNNIICKIDKSKLNDEKGDAVAAYSNMLSTLTECKLQENQRIFIRQLAEKEKSEAVNKSLSGTALPAIGTMYQIGKGISKRDVGSIVSGVASFVYTGVSAVFNYRDAVNMVDNTFRKNFFEIDQDYLRSIDAQRNSLFQTYTRFITDYKIPKRYEIKEDQMKSLVEMVASADDQSKIRLLKSKVDIFQVFTPYWYELGCAYQRTGNLASAKKCFGVFEKQKERYSIIDNDTYYTELAKNMIKIAKKENDTATIRKYLAIVESDETVENESGNRLYAAGVHLDLGEYDEALHLLKLIIDANKEFVTQARELHQYITSLEKKDDVTMLALLLGQLKIAQPDEGECVVSDIEKRVKEEKHMKPKDAFDHDFCDKDNLIFVLPSDYVKDNYYSLEAIIDKKVYITLKWDFGSKVYYICPYSAKKFYEKNKKLTVVLTGEHNEQINLEYECKYYGSNDLKLMNKAFDLLSSRKDSKIDISNISQINLDIFLTDLKNLDKDKVYKKAVDDDKVKILSEKYERAEKTLLQNPYKYKDNLLFEDKSYIFEYGVKYVSDNAKRYGVSKYGDLELMQDLVANISTSLEETYKNALLGDSDAQYNLGKAYLYGEGIATDPVEAIRWFYLSFNRNNVNAMFALAVCYEEGLGTVKNKDHAMNLYKMAAEAGHMAAKEKVSK